MSGFSIIEIIIAIGVFAIIIASLGTLFSSNQDITVGNQLLFEANLAANDILASTTEVLHQNFSSDLSTTTTLGVFTNSITISALDNFTKEIKVKVSWSIGARAHQLIQYGLVTDPADAYGSSDCELDGSENWQNPAVFSGIDLGFGNQGTAIVSEGGTVYLSANNANPRDQMADPRDFFVIDASASSNPKIISSLDTGPGLSSIALAGNYAYLGNTSINGQLQIVDVSNKTNPILLTTYKLPGNYKDETTIANSIFYNHNRIYLGTAKSQIEELHIIDVGSLNNPKEIGKWEVGAAINSIYAVSNYIYLVTPNNQELSVLDVSDPSNPQLIGGFDAPGGSGNGKSLSRDRNTLYLGRTVGKNELFALNITDPKNVAATGSIQISDSINAMFSVPGRIFLATNHKFEVIDSTNVAKMSLINSIDLPSKATGISCSGKTIYLSLLSEDALRIIKPSN